VASPPIAEVFRLLQSGDAQSALTQARRLAAAEPANVRAHMALGIALRLLGKLDESQAALERAARLDEQDYAVAYEMGATLELAGSDDALAHFERAARLRPQFAAAHRAIAAAHVARGDFDRAAAAYGAALAIAPQDPELSQLLAQVELLLGRLDAGWSSYSRREHRRHYEAQFAQQGTQYRVPSLADVAGPQGAQRGAGRHVTIVGEQGLGDNLFFLRFAPALRAAGARLAYVGDERLHPLLERTALFESLHSDRAPHAIGDSLPVLVADLPLVGPRGTQSHPPSLRVPPDAARTAAWRRRLEEAGPRPWIGVTWRAGTPSAVLARGLSKQVPVEATFAAVAPLGGTVFSLQRHAAEGELDRASAALGRKVHDLSAVNEDLEDALAVVALLDRHVGVSNTNMHLADAAGRTADVLVPFPPEWRWGAEGAASAWFPGFRVHRQRRNGDWGEALAALAR
jgi:tetratricopeptide (TPR) repeat protein